MTSDLPRAARSSPLRTARRALLGRLIDHAALFPPASLPMDAALAEDRRARATPEGWMLDRFVVPVSRLPELAVHGASPRLSVVLDGAGGAEPDRWQPALQQDLRAAGRAAASGLPIELVEVRLPGPAVGADLLAAARERVAEALGEGVRAYFEVPPGEGVAGTVAAMGEAGAAAKLRCGGAVPPPPVEDVAAFVAACRDAGVAFKATAGLHHPLRSGTAHGFLNLLAAAVFAPSDADLVALLAEEDPAAFALDDESFAVHGHRAGPDEIARARAELFNAYGSCSFSEPVDDLRALGLL